MKKYYLESVLYSSLGSILIYGLIQIILGRFSQTPISEYLVVLIYGVIVGYLATVIYLQWMIKFLNRKQLIILVIFIFAVAAVIIYLLISGQLAMLRQPTTWLTAALVEMIAVLIAHRLFKNMSVMNDQLRLFKDSK